MFNKFLSFLAASFALTGAVSAAERVESHEWLVGDAPIIKVEAFKGTIRVEPAESGKVELSLEAQASGRNAERWLERLTVKASPFGGGSGDSGQTRFLGSRVHHRPSPYAGYYFSAPGAAALHLGS